MRQCGFVKTDSISFHHLLNHFPHHVLFEQPATLPISLVYVFVCITRRLGFDAHPVAFPYKVLAVVFPPTGNAIYVDVFESATRPILSYPSDLIAMLQAMGINPEALAEFASPATTATMLLRAVGNIIHSLERIMLLKEGYHMSAHYAAYSAALLVTRNPRIIQTLFSGVWGPLDGAAVLRNALRPGLPAVLREELDLHLTQQQESERNVPRTAGRSRIKYFAGMAFRHIQYEYFAVIKGWDVGLV